MGSKSYNLKHTYHDQLERTMKDQKTETTMSKNNEQPCDSPLASPSCYAVLSDECGLVRVYLDETRADKECSLLNQTEEWDETGGASYHVERVPFHA